MHFFVVKNPIIGRRRKIAPMIIARTTFFPDLAPVSFGYEEGALTRKRSGSKLVG